MAEQSAWIASGFFALVVATPLVASSIMRRLERRRFEKRRAAMEAEWQKIEKFMAMGATPAEILNHQLRGGR